MRDGIFLTIVVLLIVAVGVTGYISSDEINTESIEVFTGEDREYNRFSVEDEKGFVDDSDEVSDIVVETDPRMERREEKLVEIEERITDKYNKEVERVQNKYSENIETKRQELRNRLQNFVDRKKQEFEERLLVKQEQYENEMEERVAGMRTQKSQELVTIQDDLTGDYFNEMLNIRLKLAILNLEEEEKSQEIEEYEQRLEYIREENREILDEKRKTLEEQMISEIADITNEYNKKLYSFGEKLSMNLNEDIREKEMAFEEELEEYVLKQERKEEKELAFLRERYNQDQEKIAFQMEANSELEY